MNMMILFLVNYLGFVVSPARIEQTTFGAEQITELFEVMNFSNDTLRIKVEFEDFDITGVNEVIFMPAGQVKNSLAPFATINPEEFTIAPQQIEKIRVTFRLPGQKLAEYYSMIIFKSQPIPTRYQAMITVAGEIGVPIYYTDAELGVRHADFEDLYIEKDSIFVVIQNSGNVHLRIRGEARVSTKKDNLIKADSIPEFVVLPGKKRIYTIPLPPNINPGDTAIARIRIDYGIAELIEGERVFVR
jgi:hypothetical protein